MLIIMNKLGQLLPVLVLLLCCFIQQTKADQSDYDMFQRFTRTGGREYINFNLENYAYFQGGGNVFLGSLGGFYPVSDPDAMRNHLQASSHWASVSRHYGGNGWGFVNLRSCVAYRLFDRPESPDIIIVRNGSSFPTLDKEKTRHELGIQ
jgi:hypothetical protein